MTTNDTPTPPKAGELDAWDSYLMGGDEQRQAGAESTVLSRLEVWGVDIHDFVKVMNEYDLKTVDQLFNKLEGLPVDFAR